MIRSAMANTSTMLCEIRTTERPRSRSVADQVVHHRRLLHAEGGRRLVEHHDPRAPEHGAADRDRLALTSRQRRHRRAQRGERHRQLVEDPPGLEAHPLDSEKPSGDAVGRTAQLAPEVQVRHHVEVVAQREVLVHRLDSGSDGVLRGVDAHRDAVDEDRSAVGGVHAGQHLDQRRLAGTVVADQRHRPPRGGPRGPPGGGPRHCRTT